MRIEVTVTIDVDEVEIATPSTCRALASDIGAALRGRRKGTTTWLGELRVTVPGRPPVTAVFPERPFGSVPSLARQLCTSGCGESEELHAVHGGCPSLHPWGLGS